MSTEKNQHCLYYDKYWLKDHGKNDAYWAIYYFLCHCFISPTTHGAVAPNNDFIAGYAAAVLKRDFKLDFTSLVVHDGVITLPVHNLTPEDRARVQQILSKIPGVTGVALQEDNNQQNTAFLHH